MVTAATVREPGSDQVRQAAAPAVPPGRQVGLLLVAVAIPALLTVMFRLQLVVTASRSPLPERRQLRYGLLWTQPYNYQVTHQL